MPSIRDTEYLNELLNSRLTLSKKETELVEENLLKQAKQVSRRYLNEARCKAALRTSSMPRFRR